MLRAWLGSMLFTVCLVPAAPGDLAATRIHSDRRVTLQIKAPQTREVKLWGEWFTKFGQLESLTKNDSGNWTITVGPLPPGIYSYLLLLDGVPAPHPGNPRIYNGRDGFEANLLEVDVDKTIYAARPVPHGSIHLHSYESSQGLGLRRVAVYTPPRYPSERKRYPVLYLLHGSGGTELYWLEICKANRILDNLFADKRLVPMIVVMPFSHAGRDDTPAREGELVHRDLMHDVLPLIERSYPVEAKPAGRALAGASMGGFQAFAFALRQPAQFGHIGLFGAGLYGTALTDDQVSAARLLQTAFLSIGSRDPNFNMSERLHYQFNQHRISHKYLVKEDQGHTGSVWRESLAEFLPLLFRQRE